jgi:hypothetical protein
MDASEVESLRMRWTEYWRTVLGEIVQGSDDAVRRLVNRIPPQAIHWRAGLLLMWIGRGAAALIAIYAFGIWMFGEGGWIEDRFFWGIAALYFATLFLPPALLVAAIGKRAYLGKGDWRWLAVLLALWLVALAFVA